jgi:hypothetical protein
MTTSLTLFHFMAFGFSSGLGYGLLRIAWLNLDFMLAAVAHKKMPSLVLCPRCHHRAPYCECEPCTHDKLTPEPFPNASDILIDAQRLEIEALRREIDALRSINHRD